MAGKKITRQAYSKIAAVGENGILARIASGETMTAIAASLGVSRPLLSAWCNHGSRADAYAHARRQAAAALADQVLHVSDGAEPETVQVAKLRADARKWLSSRLDPEIWGERAGATLNINVGALHLDALRQAGPTIEGAGGTKHDDD